MGCGVLLAILLFIVVIAALALGGSYNRLVRLQQTVDQSWAQVQNVYQRRAMDCSNSTIPFRTRSLNGKTIRASHRLPSGSCSARPMALRARRVFNALRSAIAMPWQFGYRRLLNPNQPLFTVPVTYKSFPSFCAEN